MNNYVYFSIKSYGPNPGYGGWFWRNPNTDKIFKLTPGTIYKTKTDRLTNMDEEIIQILSNVDVLIMTTGNLDAVEELE